MFIYGSSHLLSASILLILINILKHEHLEHLEMSNKKWKKKNNLIHLLDQPMGVETSLKAWWAVEEEVSGCLLVQRVQHIDLDIVPE